MIDRGFLTSRRTGRRHCRLSRSRCHGTTRASSGCHRDAPLWRRPIVSRGSTRFVLFVLGFAFVAGVLTILALCTLPVVPLVLGGSSIAGRRRTLGLLVGFGGSFVVFSVLLASVLAGAGLTTSGLRTIGPRRPRRPRRESADPVRRRLVGAPTLAARSGRRPAPRRWHWHPGWDRHGCRDRAAVGTLRGPDHETIYRRCSSSRTARCAGN